MEKQLELDMLTNNFSHSELAKLYLNALKDKEMLQYQLKQCEEDRDAAIEGQKTLQKACAVKRMKWNLVARKTGYDIYRCGSCNIPHNKQSRYCPNCGARMDGE